LKECSSFHVNSRKNRNDTRNGLKKSSFFTEGKGLKINPLVRVEVPGVCQMFTLNLVLHLQRASEKEPLFDTIEIRYCKVNEKSSTLCNLSLFICDMCLNSLEGSIYQNIWDGSTQLWVEHLVVKS
jgi:hypothetical protein